MADLRANSYSTVHIDDLLHIQSSGYLSDWPLQYLRQLKQHLLCTNIIVQFEFPTKGSVTETVRAVYTKPGTPSGNHTVTTYHLVEKFRGRQFKRCKMHQFSFVQN